MGLQQAVLGWFGLRWAGVSSEQSGELVQLVPAGYQVVPAGYQLVPACTSSPPSLKDRYVHDQTRNRLPEPLAPQTLAPQPP